MFYVYVIESKSTGKWYIGYSTDLKERVAKHNRDGNTSTSKRGQWRVIYYEAYLVRADALGREKFFKKRIGLEVPKETDEALS